MGLVLSRQLIRNEEWNRREDEAVRQFHEDQRVQEEFFMMRSIYPFYQPQQLVELQRAIRRWMAMRRTDGAAAFKKALEQMRRFLTVRDTINQFKTIQYWNLDA